MRTRSLHRPGFRMLEGVGTEKQAGRWDGRASFAMSASARSPPSGMTCIATVSTGRHTAKPTPTCHGRADPSLLSQDLRQPARSCAVARLYRVLDRPICPRTSVRGASTAQRIPGAPRNGFLAGKGNWITPSSRPSSKPSSQPEGLCSCQRSQAETARYIDGFASAGHKPRQIRARSNQIGRLHFCWVQARRGISASSPSSPEIRAPLRWSAAARPTPGPPRAPPIRRARPRQGARRGGSS